MLNYLFHNVSNYTENGTKLLKFLIYELTYFLRFTINYRLQNPFEYPVHYNALWKSLITYIDLF